MFNSKRKEKLLEGDRKSVLQMSQLGPRDPISGLKHYGEARQVARKVVFQSERNGLLLDFALKLTAPE